MSRGCNKFVTRLAYLGTCRLAIMVSLVEQNGSGGREDLREPVARQFLHLSPSVGSHLLLILRHRSQASGQVSVLQQQEGRAKDTSGAASRGCRSGGGGGTRRGVVVVVVVVVEAVRVSWAVVVRHGGGSSRQRCGWGLLPWPVSNVARCKRPVTSFAQLMTGGAATWVPDASTVGRVPAAASTRLRCTMTSEAPLTYNRTSRPRTRPAYSRVRHRGHPRRRRVQCVPPSAPVTPM